MNLEDIFDSLVTNAFDFLLKGVKEFEGAPKYSVVHFTAAVEMFLKARLMKEHWSLIVSKPDQAAVSKFTSGEFISVSLEESRVRLRDIAGQIIDDQAFASFSKLARHRNKMVHFFHPDVDATGRAKELIVAEQCRSWFHLHRLLLQWDEHFSEYQEQTQAADAAMKKQRQYLKAKFEALSEKLSEYAEAGRAPRECEACGFLAAIPEDLTSEIAETTCLVCDHSETQVEMECPDCAETILITGEGFATCEHCGCTIEPEAIVHALTDEVDAYIAMTDGGGSDFPANCGRCGGYHTVVQASDQYFCASCFEITDEAEPCGWCNECNTGDMEFSYALGCDHCEGQAGHMKDD